MSNQYINIKRVLAKKRKKISCVPSAEAVKHRHNQLQNTILLFQKEKLATQTISLSTIYKETPDIDSNTKAQRNPMFSR